MAVNKIDEKTVFIELIGGPRDGKIIQIPEVKVSVKIKSPLRSDIFYRYLLDMAMMHKEPIPYRFAGYINK